MFSKEYSVTITTEDDLFSIIFGSFYVELLGAYKYSYAESVILKTNGYGGDFFWTEEDYNYYSETYETDYDCYSIYNVFIEESCIGCYSKSGSSLEKIDAVLIPTSLSKLGVH